jgi:hypothetical protein
MASTVLAQDPTLDHTTCISPQGEKFRLAPGVAFLANTVAIAGGMAVFAGIVGAAGYLIRLF